MADKRKPLTDDEPTDFVWRAAEAAMDEDLEGCRAMLAAMREFFAAKQGEETLH